MKLRVGEWAGLAIVVASFAIGYYFYPRLPEIVASHWNAQGQADGYTNRYWGAFLLPIIQAAMFLLFVFIPMIDPKKENIKKFREFYDVFIVAMLLFMTYIYLLTIAWALGQRFEMVQLLTPAFAVLFFAVGFMVEKAEPNYTIGIRTPWTLASEPVWRKTHELGGKMFKVGSIITLLGIAYPVYAIWFVLTPIILVSIFLTIYSYFLFKDKR